MADSKYAAMHESQIAEAVATVTGAPAVVIHNPMPGVTEIIHAGPANPDGTEAKVLVLSPKGGKEIIIGQIDTYAKGKLTASATGEIKDGQLANVSACSVNGVCGDQYPSVLVRRILNPALP